MGEFRALEELSMEDCQLTGAGFERLTKLNKLSALRILNNPITDDGIAHLERCPNLEILSLAYTKASSCGMESVGKLTKLRELYVHEGDIDDRGLEHLQNLRNLEMLGLYKTHVTDAGPKYLAGCRHLKALDLNDTEITDAGLSELTSLPLEQLFHRRARCVALRRAAFEVANAALPYCAVTIASALPFLAARAKIQARSRLAPPSITTS